MVPDYEGEPTDLGVLNARIGLGGAQLISNSLQTGSSLGVGFGDTVSRVIAAINFGAVGPIHLVALTGGVNGYLRTVMSSRVDLGTDSEMTTVIAIPSPIVVSTTAMALALKAEPIIGDILRRARGVDLAVVGIGTPSIDATLVQMGYLTVAIFQIPFIYLHLTRQPTCGRQSRRNQSHRLQYCDLVTREK